MSKKVGRNDKCPCGSGKKHKKCCDSPNKPTIPPEALSMLHAKMAKRRKEQEILKSMGICMNLIKPVKFDKKKIWVMGTKIIAVNEADETFHLFLVRILQSALGHDWIDEQIKQKEKHFIVKCLEKTEEWIKKSIKDENKVKDGLWSAPPDGWSRSLVSLAFDVYSLSHTMQLPNHLIERLKIKDQYQGARYEIAIAGVFARLGCEIQFLDADGYDEEKHCEFNALHKATGITIAVEVKSRHRKGIIHHPGTVDEKKNMKGDVHRLLNQASAKNPKNKPFFVFIDLNTPLTPQIALAEKQWFKDVGRIMDSSLVPTSENPSLYSGVFFTNFSFHYQSEQEADPVEHLGIIPEYAKYKIPNLDFVQMIDSGLRHYGNVPNIDIEEN